MPDSQEPQMPLDGYPSEVTSPYMCRIKIISDGTRFGSYLVNLDTGERIAQMMSVDIQMLPNQPPIATVVIYGPSIEIVSINTRMEDRRCAPTD